MAYFQKRYHPLGTPPGTLTSDAPADAVTLHLIDYEGANFRERPAAQLDDCLASLAHPDITWIHVQGDPTPDLLHRLGAAFGLHLLALEDVINTGQRPKYEDYEQGLFLVLSLPLHHKDRIDLIQASLFLGERFVISFVHGAYDPFEPVRQRLRRPETRLRQHGADLLLHALIDALIDRGFPLLDSLGGEIEVLEEALLEKPTRDTLHRIHHLKRELLLLRRVLWPQREMLSTLTRSEPALISRETLLYLRDCYDHTVHILDLTETYRDMLASMLDVYLSSVSHRLNEVMRVLTVITTLFIPPTFIVGVYGMNFDTSQPGNMPELAWPYGYLFVWGLIIMMMVSMLVYFRRKDWF